MPMCSAFGCTNRVKDGKRLFAIPSGIREAARRKVWMRRIGRADFKATLSSRLCEDHFTEDQYEPVILRKHGVKKLKANAIPSIFHHQSPPEQPTLPALGNPPLCIQDCPPSLHTPDGSSVVCTEAAPPQNGTELLPTAAAHREYDRLPSCPEHILPLTTSDAPPAACIEAAPPQSDVELPPAAAAHQDGGSKGSPCLVCGRPVTFLCEFLSDVHIHRARISKKFVCGHCLQEFTKYDGLMAHITGISSLKFKPSAENKARLPPVIPRRHFLCFYCDTVFETSSARLSHMLLHTTATQEGFCQAPQRNPKTASGAPQKDRQQGRVKNRRRPVKVLATGPSQICLDNALKPATRPKMVVKVVATSESGAGPSQICLYDVPKPASQPNTTVKAFSTSESGPGPSQICLDDVPKPASQLKRIIRAINSSESSSGHRQIKVVAPCLFEISQGVSVVQRQPKMVEKRLNNAIYLPGRKQFKICAPSANSPSVPVAQQQLETAVKKLNNASSRPSSKQIIILAPCPSKVCPNVPVVQKQPETTVNKHNDASSLPRPSNVCPSMAVAQKQPETTVKKCDASSLPRPSKVCPSMAVVQKQPETTVKKRNDASSLPRPSKVCPNVVVVQKQPETTVKKRNDASSLPHPSKVCPSVPVVQKQPETMVKKRNDASSLPGKRPSNTIGTLPAHQKQRILSTVYCNHCNWKFSTLKLLDKHYWSHHSNLDLPLDLAFEVGSGDVAPAASPCPACVKRTECVNILSRLLEETVRDAET